MRADYSSTDYYAQSPTNDPSGPPTGSPRVQRGGRWQSRAGRCRSAYRGQAPPDFRKVGVRLASVLANE